MSECQNLQQQIDEYLSNRLSDFARGRIDNHLRQCANCTTEVGDYRMIISQLRSAAQQAKIEPSLALQFRLERLASLPKQTAPVTRQSSFSTLIWSSLTLCLIALLTIFSFFEATDLSLVVSLIAVLAGTIVLSHTLIQSIRKYRSMK